MPITICVDNKALYRMSYRVDHDDKPKNHGIREIVLLSVVTQYPRMARRFQTVRVMNQ